MDVMSLIVVVQNDANVLRLQLAASKKQDRVLRRQSEFESLKETGQRLQPVPWLLLNYKRTEVGHLRYCMTISRKVGSAVIRNRLKRWVREYFRKSPLLKQLSVEPSLDINV